MFMDDPPGLEMSQAAYRLITVFRLPEEPAPLAAAESFLLLLKAQFMDVSE